MAGVAGGLAQRLGVDPVVMRLAFVVLAFAGGAGVLLYILMWLLAPENDHTAPAHPGQTQHAAGVGFITAGALLVLRAVGLWFGDALVWPVAVAAFGSAVIYARGDVPHDAPWSRLMARFPSGLAETLGRTSPLRLLAGAALIATSMAAFLAANDALAAARNVFLAVAAAATGLGLIAGPWAWRTGAQLAEERRERIRTSERAEIAAHLHDSVLQTLALIQRAGSPQEMVSLAHGQERELRAWLYGARSRSDQAMLGAAVESAATRIEQRHHVVVDVVVVGDRPLDQRLEALVSAATEAMTNAARHSGATTISVYVETTEEAVTAYVRDSGSGFVIDAVPRDRGGIAHSMNDRMARHGGTVAIASAPERGTDVELHLTVKER